MQVEPDVAGGLWEGVGIPQVWAASHLLPCLGEGLLKAGLQTVCPGTTWPPQGLTPVQASTRDWKGFEPVGWRGDLFLIVVLSSQPETVRVDLETADQVSGGTF